MYGSTPTLQVSNQTAPTTARSDSADTMSHSAGGEEDEGDHVMSGESSDHHQHQQQQIDSAENGHGGRDEEEDDVGDEALRLVMTLDEDDPPLPPTIAHIDLDDTALRKAASLMDSTVARSNEMSPHHEVPPAPPSSGGNDGGSDTVRHASSNPVMFPSDDILRELSAVSFRTILSEIQQFLDNMAATSHAQFPPGIMCPTSPAAVPLESACISQASLPSVSTVLAAEQEIAHQPTRQHSEVSRHSSESSLIGIDVSVILPDIINSVSIPPPPPSNSSSTPADSIGNDLDGRGSCGGVSTGDVDVKRIEHIPDSERQYGHLTVGTSTY